MKPHTIRLTNLKTLIEKHFDGKAGRFADALGKKRPMVYRLFSEVAADPRNIGEEFAREIELKLGYPVGWLDIDHTQPNPPEPKAASFADADAVIRTAVQQPDSASYLVRQVPATVNQPRTCVLAFIEPHELTLLHHYRRTDELGRKLIEKIASEQTTDASLLKLAK